ncbi:MAG TPA: RHS repeat-associated core domain-containing protein, partial [Thermoanaerobaculia bacterium]|nr:RHS repeat-associated core domain-containing protein [Thermoanaerobaculia bacterium]
YDPLNRLASVRQTLSTAPGGSILTSYGYDIAGNLTSVVDPNGNTTTYAFDDFGRMRVQASPVTGTTSYAYDAAGNLTSTTDANSATTERTYDALGRVTGSTSYRAGLDTETIAYSYDQDACGFGNGVGRVSEIDDPTGGTSYCYDRRGLLISEGNAYQTSFQYDINGNRSSIVYPDGRTVTYTFDLANRPNSAAADGIPVVTAASYLPFGPNTQLDFSNGTTKTTTFDSRFRPVENKLTRAAATLADYRYVEDAAGNIVQIHDLADATYNRDFGYDDLNRLTTANSGTSLWGSSTYNYDAMGNMTSLQLGARSLTFSYVGTTPKLQSVTGSSSQLMTYDQAGNETSAVAYNARNLLLRIGTPPFDQSIVYSYDGRGVRVGALMSIYPRTPSPQPHRNWVYSHELHLLAQTDWISHITLGGQFEGTDYIWFEDTPVAQASTNPALPLRYTFADHLGTPILQTDPSATIVWRAEYEPFGSVWSYRAGSATDQILRFPGQELSDFGSDDGTGQSYNIFRWYRSGWGRYTQPDPFGLFGSMNLYSYANGDPVLAIDLLGLKVYQCFRPLSNPWLNLLRLIPGLMIAQPPAPGSKWCPMHEYIYNDSGGGRSMGFDPKEAGVKDEAGPAKDRCYEILEPVGQCVWKNFPSTANAKPYNFFKWNCQISVEATKTKCKNAPCLAPTFPSGGTPW